MPDTSYWVSNYLWLFPSFRYVWPVLVTLVGYVAARRWPGRLAPARGAFGRVWVAGAVLLAVANRHAPDSGERYVRIATEYLVGGAALAVPLEAAELVLQVGARWPDAVRLVAAIAAGVLVVPLMSFIVLLFTY